MKNKYVYSRIFLVAVVLLAILVVLFPDNSQLSNRQYKFEGPDIPIIHEREVHPKIESILFDLMKIYFTQGIERAKEFAKCRSIDMEGDLVRVVVEAIPNIEANEISNKKEFDGGIYVLIKKIEAIGGKIETTHRHLIQSIVPLYVIEDLANFPSIQYLRLPKKPIPCVISEGVKKTGADQWQNISAYRAESKAKVCILDVGFKGYKNLLGEELPSSVVTKSFRHDGNLEAHQHGTACAEIVNDMAPEVELIFVNFGTDVEHHNAVDWIINQGVDIISYSLGWIDWGAGDGTGWICEDVNKAHKKGIIWASAAGNEAQNHWEGIFRDPNSDGWCNFEKPGETVSEWFAFYVYKGDTYSVYLNWDDWGSWNGYYYSDSEGNDYDLYLYGPYPYYTLYGRSINDQTKGALPTEWVSFKAGSTGWRYICINKWWSRRDCKLELFFENAYYLEHKEVLGSLIIPADSPNAIAVGATDWSDDSYHSYSSRGPTSDKRKKPDLSAPSGVSGATYGSFSFYGTSASTPHVAGAFALLKNKIPYSLDEIKAIIDARAIDLGHPGKDFRFGLGRLNLLK